MYEKFLANPEGELRNLFKVRKIFKDYVRLDNLRLG